MIDVIVDKERNLKNLKQVGTPQNEDKIYVENLVYSKIKEDHPRERTIFVFMGHTERMNGTYATFVEAALPVRDMEFVGGIPQWSNKIWSGVFREIKRLYEDLIIVGWAYDRKGLEPKITRELERVHREFFGGIHQIFLLVDSMEQEEIFYAYKESNLIAKEGFYIYYRSKTAAEKHGVPKFEVIDLNLEVLDEKTDDDNGRVLEGYFQPEVLSTKGGRYRQLLQAHQQATEKEGSNLGIAVAVVLLIFVIGVGAYENRDTLFGSKKNSSHQQAGYTVTENTESEAEAVNSTEASNAGDTIPVEIIPGETEKSSE